MIGEQRIGRKSSPKANLMGDESQDTSLIRKYMRESKGSNYMEERKPSKAPFKLESTGVTPKKKFD